MAFIQGTRRTLITRSPVVAAAGSFTPADLPNLVAWYEADSDVFSDAGTTPAVNNDQVAQWNDQSGNGYHLQKGGVTGLTYKTSVLNGLPVLDNDGTMGLFTDSPTNPVSFGGTVASAFMVVKVTGAGGAALRMFSLAHDTGELNADAFIIYSNNSLTDIKTHNAGDKGVCTLSSGNWNQVGTVFDGSFDTMYVAGSAGTPVAATPTFNATMNLGAACDPGGGQGMIGQVAEVVLTKSALSGGNIASLTSYFTSKWGV